MRGNIFCSNDPHRIPQIFTITEQISLLVLLCLPTFMVEAPTEVTKRRVAPAEKNVIFLNNNNNKKKSG